MLTCFLDSNVLIEAISKYSVSCLAVLKEFSLNSNIQPVVSEDVMTEVLRRIRLIDGRKKVGAAREIILNISNLRLLSEHEYRHNLPIFKPRVKDPDDLPHVCAAVEAGCRWFITLNRRLARETEDVAFEFIEPKDWLKIIKRELF